MAAWSWVVTAGPSGGREMTVAKDRKLTFRRKAAATAEFSIDGRHEEASEIVELVSDLQVWRAGTALFRGRFGPSNDDIDATAHTAKFTVPDYRGRLARRLLYAADALGPYVGTDVGTLAYTPVGLVQGRLNGDEGITAGVGIPAGVVAASTTFQAGQTAAQAIDVVATSSAAPFDWEIDANLKMNVYPGARGSVLGLALEFGGAITKLGRTFDPSTYADALRLSGTQAAGSAEVEASDMATRPEGRWELQIGNSDLATAGMVTDGAAAALTLHEVALPGYTLTLAPGWWEGPGHVWLGDIIELRVRSGRLDEDGAFMVEQVTVEIDGDGTEKVTLNVGTLALVDSEYAVLIAKRLRDLERR